MIILAIIWFLLIDVPLSLMRVLLIPLGLIIVPTALVFAKEEDGVRRLPSWASLWDNPDYGTYGNNSYQTNKAYNPLFYKNPKGFWSQYYWLCIRNPVNGATRSKLFSVSQSDCDFVRYTGNIKVDNYLLGFQFVYAKSGARLYTGVYLYNKYGEYRIGFKLLPDEPKRSRRTGMTFIINPLKNL